MTVLAIDTSTNVMGIALMKEKQIIGEVITYINKNHSVRLMPAIEQLMKECNVKPNELTKIAVAKGPGSYTGVRIGVTVAKTLAYTLNIPLVGISSLKLLAANGRYFNGLVCSLFDARRTQLYTGLYDAKNGQIETVIDDCNILREQWVEQLKTYEQPILFVGNDVSLHEDYLKEALGDMAVFTNQNNQRPSELAYFSLIEKEEESVHHFTPEYLRLAEAEANWIANQQK
jgi:tRNA threonylcarbamoyladenosine biosynthesis protein TsaB